jgi:Ni2+-binding GTPase involved in maturation of urease and hydrogenase
VLLVGAPGSGKTSVLAELAQRRRSRYSQDVVVRFIGATPRSVEVRTLVQYLTTVLRQRRGGGGPDPSLATDAAVAAFRAEIEQPRSGRGTLLVIEGLD